MQDLRLGKTPLVVAISIALAVTGLAVAAGRSAASQPHQTGATQVTQGEVLSLADGGSADPASRAASSRGSESDRGNSSSNQPVEPPADAAAQAETEGKSKGPGLAAPPPSPFQGAASAFAARNAPGKVVRVGIQAGHWRNAELPDELAMLKGSTGATGPGWKEADANLGVSQRIAKLLSTTGIQVDLIPATVPVGYKANAFVAIHADANGNKNASGFKIARATWSTIPKQDDALISAITNAYRPATTLAWDAKTITDRMTEYYAFDRRVKHSVDPSTPSVIVEMGFLTNPFDQHLLLNEPDRVADAIAAGILNFLQ